MVSMSLRKRALDAAGSIATPKRRKLLSRLLAPRPKASWVVVAPSVPDQVEEEHVKVAGVPPASVERVRNDHEEDKDVSAEENVGEQVNGHETEFGRDVLEEFDVMVAEGVGETEGFHGKPDVGERQGLENKEVLEQIDVQEPKEVRALAEARSKTDGPDRMDLDEAEDLHAEDDREEKTRTGNELVREGSVLEDGELRESDVAISSNALPPKHAASEPKPQQDTQVHALLHPEPTGAIHASRQTGLPDRTLEVQEVARPCVEPCQTPPMVPESTISQHTPNGLVSATTIPQPQESTAHGDRMEGKPADVNSTLISVPVTSAVPAPQTVVPPASTSPVTLFVPDPQTQCTSKNVAPAPVPAPRPQPQTVLADGRRTRGAVQQKQAPAAQKQVVLRPVVSQSAQQRARFGPPKQMKTRPTVAKLAITRLVKNSVQASLLMTRPEFPKPPFSQILGFMHADRIAQLRTAEKAVWNATPRAPVPNKVPTPPVYRSKSSQQVVVRGLHHAVSSEDLKVALSFGSIESVKIEACGDTTTVTARILFTNCGDAKRAVNEMNGRVADGKRLQATLAQPDIIGSASHRPPFRPKVVAPLNYRRLLPRPSKPLAPPPPRMNLLDGPIPKAALQPVPQPHAAVSKWQQFAAETAPEVHPALANEPVGDGNLHRNGENFRPTRNWETRMPGPGIPDRSFNRHWPSEMVRNTFNPMIRNAPTIRADCSNSTPHSSLPVRRLDKPAGRNNPLKRTNDAMDTHRPPPTDRMKCTQNATDTRLPPVMAQHLTPPNLLPNKRDASSGNETAPCFPSSSRLVPQSRAQARVSQSALVSPAACSSLASGSTAVKGGPAAAQSAAVNCAQAARRAAAIPAPALPGITRPVSSSNGHACLRTSNGHAADRKVQDNVWARLGPAVRVPPSSVPSTRTVHFRDRMHRSHPQRIVNFKGRPNHQTLVDVLDRDMEHYRGLVGLPVWTS